MPAVSTASAVELLVNQNNRRRSRKNLKRHSHHKAKQNLQVEFIDEDPFSFE
jgi:hypothetical protein